MSEREKIAGDRVPLIITVGIFVVLLICLPLAWLLDESHDGNRPLYEDLLTMQNLQGSLVFNKEPPVAVTVSDGESEEIGNLTFTASDGVTVVVRVIDDNSFCVSGSNDNGVKSPERCND